MVKQFTRKVRYQYSFYGFKTNVIFDTRGRIYQESCYSKEAWKVLELLIDDEGNNIYDGTQKLEYYNPNRFQKVTHVTYRNEDIKRTIVLSWKEFIKLGRPKSILEKTVIETVNKIGE